MANPSKRELNNRKQSYLNKLLHPLPNNLLRMKRMNTRRMTIMMRRTTRVSTGRMTSMERRIRSQRGMKLVLVL